MKHIFSVSMITLIVLGTFALAFRIQPVKAAGVERASEMAYHVSPALISLGETGYVEGTEFKLNVTVTGAADMYGLSIRFSWDTSYLYYVSHTPRIPVETYPGGVLHEPTFFTKDEVNETAGTYWLAVATLGSMPFNGDGTVFEITFRVGYQPNWREVPPSPNNYVSLPFHLYGTETPCYDGELRLYSPPPDWPLPPSVNVMPEIIGDKHANETFPLEVWLEGGGGYDLDPFYDVSGVDIYLHFDSSLLEALSLTIDPDGWFASFWANGITETAKEINNTAGTVRAAFNASDGFHIAALGHGCIVIVEFRAVSESSTWPPPSCTLELKNPPPHPVIDGVETQVYVEGYQHPEYDFPPWNGSDSRVQLPDSVQNATYYVRYENGISVSILSPTAKNYSKETLWLNVTANVPIENWSYSINKGANFSFTANTTINVIQGENNLTVYGSSFGMTCSLSIRFYALAGDADEDRDVDIFDIVAIAGVYGVSQPNPRYKANCDIDGDGDIDIFDLVAAAGNYGKSW